MRPLVTKSISEICLISLVYANLRFLDSNVGLELIIRGK